MHAVSFFHANEEHSSKKIYLDKSQMPQKLQEILKTEVFMQVYCTPKGTFSIINLGVGHIDQIDGQYFCKA